MKNSFAHISTDVVHLSGAGTGEEGLILTLCEL